MTSDKSKFNEHSVFTTTCPILDYCENALTLYIKKHKSMKEMINRFDMEIGTRLTEKIGLLIGENFISLRIKRRRTPFVHKYW